jgi:hypothetical protein
VEVVLVAEVLAQSALGIELLDTGRALESHVRRHDDDALVTFKFPISF